MTAPQPRTLTLELVYRAPDCISGRVSDATGAGTHFVGWLGLAGAIETHALAGPVRTPPSRRWRRLR